MLSRQSLRVLLSIRSSSSSSSTCGGVRGFAVKLADIPPPVSDAFKEAFKKAAPNLNLPKFPSQFMAPRPPVPSTLPSKLTVNFVLPYKTELEAKEVNIVCNSRPL